MRARNVLLSVLSDGETFGGAEGAAILIGPTEDKLTDEQLDDFENGELPMSILEAWPHVEFDVTAGGNLVAVLHGIPGATEAQEIVLVTAAQLALLS